MKKKIDVKKLTLSAVLIALSFVLSLVKVFEMPLGGSVTLLSMLPVCMISIMYGCKWGVFCGFIYSLTQFAMGIGSVVGWGLTPGMLIACIFLDYLGAFTVLGIAGLFRKKGLPGWIGGITLAVGLRFVLHFLSGVVIWHSFGELWNGFATDNTYLYSFLYNGCYMLPELIFTLAGAVALLKVPQTKRFLLTEE